MDKHDLNLTTNDLLAGKGTRLEIIADYAMMIGRIDEQAEQIEALKEDGERLAKAIYAHKNKLATEIIKDVGISMRSSDYVRLKINPIANDELIAHELLMKKIGGEK